MGTSECEDKISLYYVAFGIVVLPILFICIRKFLNVIKKSTEIYKNDITNILKLTTELVTELKEYDQTTGGQNDHDFARMQEWAVTFRYETLASVASPFEKLEQNFENFVQETQSLWERLEQVTEDEQLHENEMKKRLLEISTQSRKVRDEGIGEPSPEAFDTETCSVLLAAVKDCMDRIVNESKRNCNYNPVIELSTFVKQKYHNMEELVNFTMNERQLQIDLLSAETEAFEKHLLDISTALNGKIAGEQAITKSQKLLYRKFVNFSSKCDAKWELFCSDLDAARETADDALANLGFSCGRMSRISCSLTQNTSDLEESKRMLGDAVQKTVAIAEIECLEIKRIEEVFDAIETMKGVLANIEEEYRLEMRAISESLETPNQTLESFVRYVQNMGFVDDLLNNIVKKFEGPSVVVPGSEQDDIRVEEDVTDDVTDNETLSVTSELSSCQIGDGPSNLVWPGVNRERNDESGVSKKNRSREVDEYLTLRRMASMFQEVLRKEALERVENDEGSLKSNFSLKDVMVRLGRGFDWSFVPSEDSLSDVTNDCLVESSSEDEDDHTV